MNGAVQRVPAGGQFAGDADMRSRRDAAAGIHHRAATMLDVEVVALLSPVRDVEGHRSVRRRRRGQRDEVVSQAHRP